MAKKIVNGVIQTAADSNDNDLGTTSSFAICMGQNISWTKFGIFMFICGILGGFPGLLMGGLVAIAVRFSSSSNSTDSSNSNSNSDRASGNTNIRSIGDYPKPVKC